MAPVVDGALAHERARHRQVEAVGEVPQGLRRVLPKDPVARQDEWARRAGEEPRSMSDRLVGRFREVGLGRVDRAHLVGDGRSREVLRELDVRRSRLLELGDTEGLAHDLRDRRGLLDPLVPFRHGLEHADDVDELVRFLVELCRVRSGP